MKLDKSPLIDFVSHLPVELLSLQFCFPVSKNVEDGFKLRKKLSDLDGITRFLFVVSQPRHSSLLTRRRTNSFIRFRESFMSHSQRRYS